jgi:hypothetical protein
MHFGWVGRWDDVHKSVASCQRDEYSAAHFRDAVSENRGGWFGRRTRMRDSSGQLSAEVSEAFAPVPRFLARVCHGEHHDLLW